MGNYMNKENLKKAFELQKGYIDAKDATKQDKFTTGTGLALEGGVLRVTIDHTIYKVVDSLPTKPASGDENKIHCVLSEESETDNQYTEYIYIASQNKWEKLGTFKPEVDLTPYLKIANITATIGTTGFSISKDAGANKLVEVALSEDLTGTVSGTKVTVALKDVLSAAVNSGMYKVSVDKKGRITGTAAITLDDLTALGVATKSDLTALDSRVQVVETFIANPMTDQEVQDMYNEVFG